MTLIYTDYSDVCTDDSLVSRDINIDYINANFTVNSTVLCDSIGDFIVDNISSVDNDT